MNLTFDEIYKIGTAFIYLGGLGLSIYNFILNRKDKIPRLVIRVSKETTDYSISEEGIESPPEDYFVISIANPSDKRIKISSIFLSQKDKNYFLTPSKEKPPYLSGMKIPSVLSPYDSTTYVTPWDEFIYWLSDLLCKEQEVTVKIWVVDAIGKSYSGNKLKCHLH